MVIDSKPVDSRFVFSPGTKRAFVTLSPFLIEADTVEELYRQWQTAVATAEMTAGRSLSKRELATFADREDSRSRYEVEEQARRNDAELNAKPADTRSREQIIVDDLAARVAAEKRAKLTLAEQHLLDAQEKLAAKIKADEAAAAAAKIRETGGYKRLRDELDRAILTARFDPTISVAMLERLQHQSELLERKLDVAAVGHNVGELRKSLMSNLEPERLALKAAQDKLAAREAALRPALWDDVSHEVIGGIEYVVLAADGRTAKVSKQRFDSTPHEELRTNLFGAPANV